MAVTGWRARPVACVSIVFAVGHHSGCSALRERGVHFIFELEGLTGKTWPQVGWSEGFCRGCQETLAMTPNSSAMRITDFLGRAPHFRPATLCARAAAGGSWRRYNNAEDRPYFYRIEVIGPETQLAILAAHHHLNVSHREGTIVTGLNSLHLEKSKSYYRLFYVSEEAVLRAGKCLVTLMRPPCRSADTQSRDRLKTRRDRTAFR